MNSAHTLKFMLCVTVDFFRENNSELEAKQGKLGPALKRICNILITLISRNRKDTLFFLAGL